MKNNLEIDLSILKSRRTREMRRVHAMIAALPLGSLVPLHQVRAAGIPALDEVEVRAESMGRLGAEFSQ